MDNERGGHGAYWDALLRLLDSVCYGIEWSRGMILDPSSAIVEACVQFLRSYLDPRPKRDVEDVRRAEEENRSYCLNSSPLSFFDRFLCLNGIPAYFIPGSDDIFARKAAVRPPDAGTSKDAAKDSKGAKRHTARGTPFAVDNSGTVGVCAFSNDSSKFAICYESGEVIIWDIDHGTQLEKTVIEGGSVSNVSFLAEDNSVLLIYTKDYTYWKWNVNDEVSKPSKMTKRVLLSIIQGKIISQRSCFCENGTKLVFATIIDAQPKPLLEVISTDTTSDLGDHRHCLSFSVPIQESFVISKILVSPDGKGVLVGLMDKKLEDSFCIFWPNFVRSPATYKKLDKGTIGTWSKDSKHVVTWIMTNRLNSEVDDETSAFIWDVEEMRENLNNPACSFKPKKITNPFGDKVFWCQLTQDMEEKDQLIMGIGGELTKFLFWNVETKTQTHTHTHTIETNISTKDMTLCNQEAWIESCVKQNNVKGLSPIDVANDGSIFGAVLGLPSQVVVWDTYLGVERLNASPKDLHANHFKGGTDLMASPSNRRFAIIGKNGVMVFCPSDQSDRKTQKKGHVEAQMVQYDNLNTIHNNTASYKMRFSGDGNSLGVLCIGLSKMQVWNLTQGTSCTIDVAHNTEGEKIQDFCIARNGQYLAIYTGKYIQIVECKAEDVAQVIGDRN